MTGNTALLVIDVQMAMFLSGEGVYHSGETLSQILKVIHLARDKQIPIIFIQHCEDGDPEYSPGTDLWQLHPDLARREDEPLIYKTKWDSFYQTNLDETLKSLGIQKLIVCGMQTEFCLDTTLRSAFFHGYKCYLPKGGHTTFTTDVLPAEKIIAHHEKIWQGRFADLVDLQQINGIIAQQPLIKEDEAFCMSVKNGGATAWASFFAENGKMLSKSGENVVGKEAIENAMSDFFKSKDLVFKWHPEHGILSKSKDLGYTYGTYERSYMNTDGESVHQVGRYLTVWRLQSDGTYKVEVDIGN